MVTTTNKQTIKLVKIGNMLVPESKVEGRLKALAKGREIKAQLEADQAKEDQKLAEEGYSQTDINCLRHANRIARLEAQGHGTIKRCRIGSPKRSRQGTTYDVVENLQLTEVADKLLVECN